MSAITVVSWNLAGMKPARFRSVENRKKQWAQLAELTPVIALLQECYPGDLERFAPATMRDEYAAIGSVKNRRSARSVILAHRGLAVREVETDEFERVEREWMRYLGGYVAVCRVELGGQPTLVASVHSLAGAIRPAKIDASAPVPSELARSRRKYPSHNDLVVAALMAIAGDSFIVGGDWNIARHFDISTPRTRPGNSEFFDRRTAHGWHDALRKAHTEEQQTYFGKNVGPYELDHIFTNAARHDTIEAAYIVAPPLNDALSDHGPLVVRFDGHVVTG